MFFGILNFAMRKIVNLKLRLMTLIEAKCLAENNMYSNKIGGVSWIDLTVRMQGRLKTFIHLSLGLK